MAPELNIEVEAEPNYQEVTEEVLARFGWDLMPRSNGQDFRVLIHQLSDLEIALTTGRGLLAEHGLVTQDGRRVLALHDDMLRLSRLGDKKTMVTVYSPSIGHESRIVLIEKK